MLLDFPLHIDLISMGLPIVYFKGSPVSFSRLRCISVHECCLILANSADPGEIKYFIWIFPTYPFRGFPYIKG